MNDTPPKTVGTALIRAGWNTNHRHREEERSDDMATQNTKSIEPHTFNLSDPFNHVPG
jgi:hypothetical protein